MVGNKIKRIGGLVAAFIILMCCTVLPTYALQYSNNYPSYIPYVGAIYCEVQSSPLGLGSLVFSSSISKGAISIGSGSNNLYNSTSSTISGIFRTSQGVDYNIRAAAYSSFQYAVTSGYNTTYYDLNISQIISTNLQFVDYSDSDKQNDNYYFASNFEKGVFALLIFNTLISALSVFVLVRIKHD